MSYFEGPWIVCDVDSLEKKPRVKKGEIIIHKSGPLVLACPKCGAMQFAIGSVEGDKAFPTIRGTVTCGSGHCAKCAFCFTVRNGKTVEEKAPTAQKKEISFDKFIKSGVRKPPKIPK